MPVAENRFATVERVDHLEHRMNRRFDEVNARIDSVKEDVQAISDTVLDLREGQERMDGELRWVRANMRAVMGHLGVPEAEAADER